MGELSRNGIVLAVGGLRECGSSGCCTVVGAVGGDDKALRKNRGRFETCRGSDGGNHDYLRWQQRLSSPVPLPE